MEILVVLCAITVVALVGLVYWLRSGKIKGIPEPPGNFVLGHVFHAGGNFCKTFLSWKKLVGPVFQLRFFKVRIVVFNDKESISKVCAMPEASGRARAGLFELASEILGEGVAMADGPLWAEQRNLLVKSLKTFGIGHHHGTEQRLQDEISDALREWEELKGSPFQLLGCNTPFVFNTLWSVIASKRVERSAILQLSRHAHSITKMDNVGHKIAAVSVDFAKTFTNAVEEKRQGFQAVATVARESVLEHQKDRVPNQPRDVIDVILDKMDETDDFNSAFHKKNLKNGFALGDIILATIDTTTRSLEWLMFYLALNPEAESKLYAEIKRLFGDDLESWPSLADREHMPFTQACILETLRMSSVVPTGPHRAMEDFDFNGALIPKGTILIMNLYGVHHDPQVWDQPEEFVPGRFLTPEGDNIDLNVKSKVVAFGIGRRICPGFSLAMDSMFLYVVNAYRKFRFEVVGEVDSLRRKIRNQYLPSEKH